ncbi:recombinase family protein [Geomonas ferrireducens]|uniref:recombinase family protein n=1 Tax=Geomonas ferrireducens TaxID=2570227 RepID=UPI0010A9114F|nr:recombinase family protein [Geomonas ferrireducens]
MGRVIGYKRVSSLEQNLERQLEGVELDVEFLEKKSGKDRERPELQNLLKTAWKGDHIMVHSIDRLARNMVDLLGIVKELVNRGVKITFVKEGLTFTGDENDIFKNLMLKMLGAFAEFERDLSKSRQREGIELKKAAGGYKGKGRKKSITDEMVAKIKERVTAGEKKTKIAADLGISRESIYKLLKA